MSSELRSLLKGYRDAVVALAWVGSRDPEEHADIRKEHRTARRALVQRLDELEALELDAKEVSA